MLRLKINIWILSIGLLLAGVTNAQSYNLFDPNIDIKQLSACNVKRLTMAQCDSIVLSKDHKIAYVLNFSGHDFDVVMDLKNGLQVKWRIELDLYFNPTRMLGIRGADTIENKYYSYKYDKDGVILKSVEYNKLTARQVVDKYQYSKQSLLGTTTLSIKGLDTIVSHQTYEYDRFSRLKTYKSSNQTIVYTYKGKHLHKIWKKTLTKEGVKHEKTFQYYDKGSGLIKSERIVSDLGTINKEYIYLNGVLKKQIVAQNETKTVYDYDTLGILQEISFFRKGQKVNCLKYRYN